MNFPQNNNLMSNEGQSHLMHGTTGVALRFKNGVVLVSDRRASMGTFVASKRAKKVHKVNAYTGIGIAGLVSDAQTLVDVIKSELKIYELENGFRPTVKVASSLLSTIIHGGYRRYQYWWVQLLVVGQDRRGSWAYVLDPSGSLAEEDYLAIGSGTLLAMGVLESEWKPDMTREEAKELGVKALKMAISRDTATGNGIDGLIFSSEDPEMEEIHIDL